MSYIPSSPSGTSSSTSTSPSSASSSSISLITPSPSPILLDSLSLSPSLPPAPSMHIVTVCNAPLVAPIPLPYHSPTFLQFDLPDEDADLSKPPYTRKSPSASSPSSSPQTGKRKRLEQDSDSLTSPSMSLSLAQRLDSMLLMPPQPPPPSHAFDLSASNGAPAAKRRRSFPAPFWHSTSGTGSTMSLNPPLAPFHSGAYTNANYDCNSTHTMLRATHHQQQQRALRHAISYSHSLHHKYAVPSRRLPEIPNQTTTTSLTSRNSASSFLFPFPPAQSQPAQPIHQSCSTAVATAPSGFGNPIGIGSMNMSSFDHSLSYPYHLR